MLIDRGKTYWIMELKHKTAIPGEELSLYELKTAAEFSYGKILPGKKDAVLYDHLKQQEALRVQLLEDLKDNPSSSAARRIVALEEELTRITEALKAWD